MPIKTPIFISCLFILLGLMGCNTAPTPTPAPLEPGDPDRGAALFAQPVIGTSNAVGCITCHSLQENITLVGPSIAGIASRAGETVPGQTAEEYLRLAIVEPNAYMVPGYQSGSMYLDYGRELSPQQIEDLIAYMLTLE
ncbi:MAG: cytochrome c [Anaerolineales bacterium]|nr:cytochrome c [Anaerolineales bacterium]